MGWWRIWVSYQEVTDCTGDLPFKVTISIISFTFCDLSRQVNLTGEVFNVNARDGSSEIDLGSLRDSKGSDDG